MYIQGIDRVGRKYNEKLDGLYKYSSRFYLICLTSIHRHLFFAIAVLR